MAIITRQPTVQCYKEETLEMTLSPVVKQRASPFSSILLGIIFMSTSSSPGGATEGKLEGRGGRRGRWWRAGGILFSEYYSHMIRRYFASYSRHWNYFEQILQNSKYFRFTHSIWSSWWLLLSSFPLCQWFTHCWRWASVYKRVEIWCKNVK